MVFREYLIGDTNNEETVLSDDRIGRSGQAALVVAALSCSSAFASVVGLAGPTPFGELENQSPAQGLPNFYVQPRVTTVGLPVLRVAMMAASDRGNAAARTKADFVVACGEGSDDSFYQQVTRAKSGYDHQSVFRTWGLSGHPRGSSLRGAHGVRQHRDVQLAAGQCRQTGRTAGGCHEACAV